MHHDDVQLLLLESNTLKLLQGQTAPLVLSFLYNQFKLKHQVRIFQKALQEALEDELERIHELYPDKYGRSARAYLNVWCDEQHRYLRKYFTLEGTDEPVYELTPGTEKAISWLEELGRTEFVGTESRFLRIFDILQDLKARSTEDVTLRLSQLEKQKESIQAEIDLIRTTGQVEQYSSTQIKERFFEANDVARRLLADLSEVEQNFRDIARDVQEQQLKAGNRKGDIVGYVLDADEALKESDQGRSFYAFWEFLRTPAKQSELKQLLSYVSELTQIPQTQTGQILYSIRPRLSDAGRKIIESNHRLAEQLRKLLDEQNLLEAKRVQELALDIKKLALELNDRSIKVKKFQLIEITADIQLIMEKQLWSRPKEASFTQMELNHAEVDLTDLDLTSFFNPYYVDINQIRTQIDQILEQSSPISLAAILQRYPLQKGLSEIVVYFSLHNEYELSISQSEMELVTLDEQNYQLQVPLLIFYRKRNGSYER